MQQDTPVKMSELADVSSFPIGLLPNDIFEFILCEHLLWDKTTAWHLLLSDKIVVPGGVSTLTLHWLRARIFAENRPYIDVEGCKKRYWGFMEYELMLEQRVPKTLLGRFLQLMIPYSLNHCFERRVPELKLFKDALDIGLWEHSLNRDGCIYYSLKGLTTARKCVLEAQEGQVADALSPTDVSPDFLAQYHSSSVFNSTDPYIRVCELLDHDLDLECEDVGSMTMLSVMLLRACTYSHEKPFICDHIMHVVIPLFGKCERNQHVDHAINVYGNYKNNRALYVPATYLAARMGRPDVLTRIITSTDEDPNAYVKLGDQCPIWRPVITAIIEDCPFESVPNLVYAFLEAVRCSGKAWDRNLPCFQTNGIQLNSCQIAHRSSLGRRTQSGHG